MSDGSALLSLRKLRDQHQEWYRVNKSSQGNRITILGNAQLCHLRTDPLVSDPCSVSAKVFASLAGTIFLSGWILKYQLFHSCSFGNCQGLERRKTLKLLSLYPLSFLHPSFFLSPTRQHRDNKPHPPQKYFHHYCRSSRFHLSAFSYIAACILACHDAQALPRLFEWPCLVWARTKQYIFHISS